MTCQTHSIAFSERVCTHCVGGPELRGEEKRGGSKSVDEADYHRYYDGRVAVICSDLLVVLGRIYDEVRG